MDINLHEQSEKKYLLNHGQQPFFGNRRDTYLSKILPSEAISEFYQVKNSIQQQPILVIPDGCIDIIFECDPVKPTARVCGSTLDMQNVPMQPNINYFGVRFLPGIIPEFIQASAENLLNNSINFNDIVANSADLIEQIATQNEIEQQIYLFLQRFSNQLKRNYSVTTEFIIKTILNDNEDLKLKLLEEKTGYCTRHIQRVFKHEVGISIKAFSCIMRFQSAIHALTSQTRTRLSDLTYDLGYNDQAHLHKEFKKFINMSPSGFVKHFEEYI
ncbi:helix-turn-helix domain-containing protein [Acinetobacter baylyi]|uniref:helix-turn-helix domain-containing protein n=1 Tax=Acinetobacter baylyi TaxID=202950 RepID=UPI000EA1F580|nr:helix-turn-helix domain-containing protein [Acinetobacter baylyi]